MFVNKNFILQNTSKVILEQNFRIFSYKCKWNGYVDKKTRSFKFHFELFNVSGPFHLHFFLPSLSRCFQLKSFQLNDFSATSDHHRIGSRKPILMLFKTRDAQKKIELGIPSIT